MSPFFRIAVRADHGGWPVVRTERQELRASSGATVRFNPCQENSAPAWIVGSASASRRPEGAVGAEAANTWTKQELNVSAKERTMQIVKSVGVMSVAKIMGLIYGCMGLIFAPFFLL